MWCCHLLCDVTSNEDSLKINPEVLHTKPTLQDLVCVRQVSDPFLNLLLEGCIVPKDVFMLSMCLGSTSIYENVKFTCWTEAIRES